ncbi:MAG: hypothetical protein L6R39_003739 [Caloplaca ligustica]|nr:MAG: hypothetical protein L6R39_003739 [Caloplaca ligustica]
MHNQAINSLAFVSARYTLTAVELASLMCASYVYTVCQALDLRVLQLSFFQALEPALYTVSQQAFGHLLSDLDFDELHLSIWDHIRVTWLLTANKDSDDRYVHVVDTTIGVIVKILLATTLADGPTVPAAALDAINTWKISSRKVIAETFTTISAAFFKKQNTVDFLGLGSRKIYRYVREKLGVPLHQGLKDHPEPSNMFAVDGSRKRTIGSNISIIYEALRSGALHEPLMECLMEESHATRSTKAVFDGWAGFGNGMPSMISEETNGNDVRNGRVGFDGIITNDEPKPVIVEAKRRHSISLGEISNRKRRGSLAAVQGSLTGL